MMKNKHALNEADSEIVEKSLECLPQPCDLSVNKVATTIDVEAVNSQLDKLGKEVGSISQNLTELFSGISNEVVITEFPHATDWVQAFVTFFAALGGAFVAFLLNWRHESKKEFRNRKELVNKYIVRSGTNINRLINFKTTFVKEEYWECWNTVKEFTNDYLTSNNPEELTDRWKNDVLPKIDLVCKTEPTLGGLTAQWGEITFLELDTEDLYFLRGSAADVRRLGEEINEQITGLNRTILEHNRFWVEARHVFSEGLPLNREAMAFLYHLITLNENALDFTNRGLSYSHYSLKKLSEWWNEEAEKGVLKNLFNKENRRCAEFKIPDDVKDLILPPEKYANILFPFGE